MIGYVYKTTNLVNDKIYIGKKHSSQFIKDYLGSGNLIKRAINKYGVDNFCVCIVDTAKTVDELNDKERLWIKKYNAQDLSVGYNLADGGDGGNLIKCLSEDEYNQFIEECRQRSIGKNNPNFGNGDAIRGSKNPAKRPEVRQKISEKVSGENNGMFGKTQTKDSMKKKINTTIERYGHIPNRYSVNQSNWRIVHFNDGHNELYRTRTEMIRELHKLGFSNKVIFNSFHVESDYVMLRDLPYPFQSKTTHLKALEEYPNIMIEKFKKQENTEVN